MFRNNFHLYNALFISDRSFFSSFQTKFHITATSESRKKKKANLRKVDYSRPREFSEEHMFEISFKNKKKLLWEIEYEISKYEYLQTCKWSSQKAGSICLSSEWANT